MSKDEISDEFNTARPSAFVLLELGSGVFQDRGRYRPEAHFLSPSVA